MSDDQSHWIGRLKPFKPSFIGMDVGACEMEVGDDCVQYRAASRSVLNDVEMAKSDIERFGDYLREDVDNRKLVEWGSYWKWRGENRGDARSHGGKE